MPKIVRNPRIRDNIRVVDYNIYFNGTPERQTELMDWYERGEVIVLSNYRFDAGRKVIANTSFPNGTKKLRLHSAGLNHLDEPREREWGEVRQILNNDEAKVAEFEAAVAAANAELIRLVDGLFPRYRYTKRLCIYNLTEMLAINLHFDSPQHADISTQVRAFVNMDNFPRIWHVGQSLEEVVRDFYDEAGAAKLEGGHPRAFTRAMTQAAFGDRFESGARPWPRHSIAFRPGEVWFVYPNVTAHEVIYGRRLLDAVFMFEQDDLLNKERYLPTLVERFHAERRKATPNPE